ncbi:MAG: sodium:calcium exchanger [Woeseia sp.]|nr:sodium:calcium exchanger [Woeseia sp.]
MKFLIKKLEFILYIMCFLLPNTSFAHGDGEQSLFVAASGEDNGNCTDAENPCGSIGYALSRAAKGDEIRVSSGVYPIDKAEDIFHLIGGAINVRGGQVFDNKITDNKPITSILTGVPFQYRDFLKNKGFTIVADQKSLETERIATAEKFLELHKSLMSSIPATPCVDGEAAGLPCDNVNLLSHVGFVDISSNPSEGNDIWGFVDLNTGREYAIAGFNLGTAIFDVTDATNPREIGFINGQDAVWRDVKVYQFFDDNTEHWKAYAYITTDGSTDGLFVIDLTGLPHSVQRISYLSDITSAHNIYAANTDYSTGISLTGDIPTLIIAGSSAGNGRYRSYSLDNPEAPDFIPGGTGSGYMHDASSLIIRDSRKDTQCVSTGPYCEILLDFNENMIEIWDVTEPEAPVQLSQTPYSGAEYIHSGWWSEDKQFLFVHDELDEYYLGLPTTLRTFSMADLANPALVGTWEGSTNAIDHNGFVRGNRYYMSNYTRGLTILNIADPTAPEAVGRLDTYPVSDNGSFNGAWGAYPFFHSGNIAISDINSGFYMAEDLTRGTAVGGLISFDMSSYGAEEGQPISLTVKRELGNSGPVTVDYEILHATADGEDYSTTNASLSWTDGDNSIQTIDISTMDDGISEGMERLLVRLISPDGEGALGNLNTASAYISDPGTSPSVGFLFPNADVTERYFGAIIAVVKRSGSAVGNASVDYSITGGDAIPDSDFEGSASGTITWADGDANPKIIQFEVIDDGITESNETFILTLDNPIGITISESTFAATILDGDGANLAPNALVGSSQTVPSGNEVTLDGSQSNDPNGDTLTYEWIQTSGPNVILNNANTSTATFTAPSVSSDTMFQFQLTVDDPSGLTDSVTTTITVLKSIITPEPESSGGGSLGMVSLLLLAGLFKLKRRKYRI